ncbi:MAG TPA: VOC family protein, partial [Bradyrhizobium sp.]|nr:VOC family protein [Bradyrhizobium sp.]
MFMRRRSCDNCGCEKFQHKRLENRRERTDPHSASPFQAIRAIDYTVIFVRDMAAMRRFYEDILRFSLLRELFPGWIEY